MSFLFNKQHAPRSYAARSDVGSVREHNEDSYLVRTPLFVVADGMGGHEAGEVASKIAVNTMEARAPKNLDVDALVDAVVAANKAVIKGSNDGTGKPGMGTTLTAAYFSDNDALIAQVGDSRAYLLREGKIKRITKDHSLVADLIEQGRLTEEEARFHPQRSVITRALGSDANMKPDIYPLKIEKGDRILLCSDGLSSMISDSEIEELLSTYPVPADACDALIDGALRSGGMDNVTVIVIDPLDAPPEEKEALYSEEPTADEENESVDDAMVTKTTVTVSGAMSSKEEAEEETKEDPPEDKDADQKKRRGAQHSKPKRRSKLAPFIWTLAFILIIAAAALGFFAYAQNSYYIIEEDGVVSIYRGLPGEIAGISFSWLEDSADDIDVTKLTPSTQSHLATGIAVDSLEDAQDHIAQYRQTSKG